jgi:hypothetical protein
LLFPVEVRAGSHPGDSLRASFTMQLQPARALAMRLGVHGRLGAAFSMIQEMRGYRATAPVLLASVGVDF